VQTGLAALGLTVFTSSPAAFKQFLSEQIRQYAALAEMAKIEPQ
jgi:hypothetical protein